MSRGDVVQFQTQVVRKREERREIAGQSLGQPIEYKVRFVIRDLKALHRIDPGDQQMRALMTCPAAIKDADVSAVCEPHQCIDKFVGCQVDPVHVVDVITRMLSGKFPLKNLFA